MQSLLVYISWDEDDKLILISCYNIPQVIQHHTRDTPSHKWHNITRVTQHHTSDTISHEWHNITQVTQYHTSDTTSHKKTQHHTSDTPSHKRHNITQHTIYTHKLLWNDTVYQWRKKNISIWYLFSFFIRTTVTTLYMRTICGCYPSTLKLIRWTHRKRGSANVGE